MENLVQTGPDTDIEKKSGSGPEVDNESVQTLFVKSVQLKLNR